MSRTFGSEQRRISRSLGRLSATVLLFCCASVVAEEDVSNLTRIAVISDGHSTKVGLEHTTRLAMMAADLFVEDRRFVLEIVDQAFFTESEECDDSLSRECLARVQSGMQADRLLVLHLKSDEQTFVVTTTIYSRDLEVIGEYGPVSVETFSEVVALARIAAYHSVYDTAASGGDTASPYAIQSASVRKAGIRLGGAAVKVTIPGTRPGGDLGSTVAAEGLGSLAWRMQPPLTGVALGASVDSVSADGSMMSRSESAAEDGRSTRNFSAARALGTVSTRPPERIPSGVAIGLTAARRDEEDFGIPEGPDNRESIASPPSNAAPGALAVRVGAAAETSARGSQQMTARGEILITTDPRGAVISVDGEEVGRSPLLLGRLESRTAVVEARADALYARQEVEVPAGLSRLNLTLDPTFGRLFFSTDATPLDGLQVRIDGEERGGFPDGLVPDVLIGRREIELTSSSLFWFGEVAVRAGETTTVSVNPVPVGRVTYELPEGTVARIESAEVSESTNAEVMKHLSVPSELRGAGTVERVPAGTYNATVAGDRYVPQEAEIEIVAGNSHVFAPKLDFTREYFEEMVRAEIDSIETSLAEGLGSPIGVKVEVVERAEALLRRLESSDYELREVRLRARLALRSAEEAVETQRIEERLTILRAERADLLGTVERTSRRAQRERRWRLVTLGSGVSAAGLWAGFTQAGNRAYTEYLAASVTEEALEFRAAFRTWDALSYVAATIGVASMGVNVWLSLREPPDREPKTRLNGVEQEIKGLEAQL